MKPNIQELIDRGALFVVNHSGGKDSQAMYLYLTRDIEVPHDQIVVVHADLGEVDWEDTDKHIEATTDHALHVVKNKNKTFMSMVAARGKFPSASYRQCTSDLKRDPITTFVRQYSRETDNLLIVDCQGIRAEESASRAKKKPFTLSKRNSKAGREWYVWYPVFDRSTEWVFDRIAQAGQKPFWTYAKGMARKSCKFCILASCKDLAISSMLNPDHYADMLALQDQIGHKMFQDKDGGLDLRDKVAKGLREIYLSDI